FMAKHGHGLICLTLDEQRTEQLALPMMSVPGRGRPALGTAFTVSIEAAEGVTTGISAADRAHTIQVAIRPTAKPNDLLTPGHVFPLKARRGGVLVRTGQTEGSVDLARLAGLRAAGVICEIMKDDGTMARMPDLEEFAEEHHLQITTIADLIHYRMQTEALVERVAERPITLCQTHNEWLGIVFEVAVESRQALALVKGDIGSQESVLCRVHSGSVVGDLFCSTNPSGTSDLRDAIDRIEQEGSGVLLYLDSPRTLGDEFERLGEPAPPAGAAGVPAAADSVPGLVEPSQAASSRARGILRKFGLGAQMLADLGAHKLRLLTNSRHKIAGLTGYGLEVVGLVPLTASKEDKSDG
ncbi:MAG: bifunctional 3,4-dihydroxy-2-butanone-4-phosphate synthase/GTP cyclohydrolase II, partial [Deltaproteobacteria bacterium]